MILTIEIVNGQVKLTGPLQDPKLCGQMLDAGKKALFEHCQKSQPRIEIATPEQVRALTRAA